MNSPKLNVCCAISEKQIIRPLFFDDDTVSGQNYLLMLQEVFVPEYTDLYRICSIIFHKDPTSPHYWIERRGPIRRAPHSPGLTYSDFFCELM